MFILDVETLGIESTSVVLSIACTHVTEETDTYQKMLDNSIMLKLDIQSQFDLGRVTDDHTIAWWDRQSENIKIASLYPNKEIDIHPVEAYSLLRLWLKEHDFGKQTVLARGVLDPIIMDSLARTFDISSPIPYNRYHDVRTAIDMLYENTTYGYVDVDHPTFETSLVIKHHPVHDCAYDGMMLVYGKQ